jgi:hypothetical protein
MAEQVGEGCQVYGYLLVNKVNFYYVLARYHKFDEIICSTFWRISNAFLAI